MSRLTLAGQVALVVALAILVAQALNFALAVQSRHAQMTDTTALLAAQRLGAAALEPDRLAARPSRPGDFRPRIRRRPVLTAHDPVPAGASDQPQLESRLSDALKSQNASFTSVRAARIDRPGGRRSTLIFAGRLADGRWISVRSPGPRPLGPIVGRLALQSLLIFFLVLLPTLWVIHRAGRSLGRVRSAATRFEGELPAEPVPVHGPSDVRALIEAVNAMQARIAAMLQEKDLMLGAIGHDLRTPLTALRLEAEAVGDIERREALVAQIEALHGQFEQLLDYARAGRAKAGVEAVRLDALVQELAERPDGSGRIAVERIEPALVRGDPHSLRRAIDNLVGNALRYAGSARISVEQQGAQVLVEIRDSGPGIADPMKPLALMPFGRLDQSRNRASGGHGLGLPIAAAIARAHGGRLELADSSPSGLAARLSLPALSSEQRSLD